MRPKSVALKIGYAVFLAALLGFAEVAARHYIPPRIPQEVLNDMAKAREHSMLEASDDPELMYQLRANYFRGQVRITESHRVIRDKEVSVPKPNGVYRIAVVGDSISAAFGPRFHLGAVPFPDGLEGLLQKELGNNVEVLNFGRDGYGTTQEARMIEAVIPKFRPDLIVLQYCFNDTTPTSTPAAWFGNVSQPRFRLVQAIEDFMALERGETLRDRFGGSPNFAPTGEGRAYWEKLYDPASPSWRSVETGFARIAKVASALDVPIVMAMFPLLFEGRESNSTVIHIERQVGEAAERNGFHVINVAAAYANWPIASLQEHPGEDIYHPNGLGHRLAAEALAKTILPIVQGRLDPKDRLAPTR